MVLRQELTVPAFDVTGSPSHFAAPVPGGSEVALVLLGSRRAHPRCGASSLGGDHVDGNPLRDLCGGSPRAFQLPREVVAADGAIPDHDVLTSWWRAKRGQRSGRSLITVSGIRDSSRTLRRRAWGGGCSIGGLGLSLLRMCRCRLAPSAPARGTRAPYARESAGRAHRRGSGCLPASFTCRLPVIGPEFSSAQAIPPFSPVRARHAFSDSLVGSAKSGHAYPPEYLATNARAEDHEGRVSTRNHSGDRSGALVRTR